MQQTYKQLQQTIQNIRIRADAIKQFQIIDSTADIHQEYQEHAKKAHKQIIQITKHITEQSKHLDHAISSQQHKRTQKQNKKQASRKTQEKGNT